MKVSFDEKTGVIHVSEIPAVVFYDLLADVQNFVRIYRDFNPEKIGAEK